MKFLPAKCPNCQGELQVPDNKEFVKCMYCGIDIKVRDVISVVNDLAVNIPFWFLEARKAFKTAIHNERMKVGDIISLRNSYLTIAIDNYDKILIIEPNNIDALIENAEGISKAEFKDIIPSYIPETETFYSDSLILRFVNGESFSNIVNEINIHQGSLNVVSLQMKANGIKNDINERKLLETKLESKGFALMYSEDFNRIIDLLGKIEEHICSENKKHIYGKIRDLYVQLADDFVGYLITNKMTKENKTYSEFDKLKIIDNFYYINYSAFSIVHLYERSLRYCLDNDERNDVFERIKKFLVILRDGMKVRFCYSEKGGFFGTKVIFQEYEENFDSVKNIWQLLSPCYDKYC